ncbi:MAG: hypothetical protein JHC93_04215 [Parachlamydiales bacterium]|nr:hypothetical protein [Parachlamydiales bacterium]
MTNPITNTITNVAPSQVQEDPTKRLVKKISALALIYIIGYCARNFNYFDPSQKMKSFYSNIENEIIVFPILDLITGGAIIATVDRICKIKNPRSNTLYCNELYPIFYGASLILTSSFMIGAKLYPESNHGSLITVLMIQNSVLSCTQSPLLWSKPTTEILHETNPTLITISSEAKESTKNFKQSKPKKLIKSESDWSKPAPTQLPKPFLEKKAQIFERSDVKNTITTNTIRGVLKSLKLETIPTNPKTFKNFRAALELTIGKPITDDEVRDLHKRRI